MSLQFEKQEGNMATLTIERSAEELDKAITRAYHKIRNQVTLKHQEPVFHFHTKQPLDGKNQEILQIHPA